MLSGIPHDHGPWVSWCAYTCTDQLISWCQDTVHSPLALFPVRVSRGLVPCLLKCFQGIKSLVLFVIIQSWALFFSSGQVCSQVAAHDIGLPSVGRGDCTHLPQVHGLNLWIPDGIGWWNKIFLNDCISFMKWWYHEIIFFVFVMINCCQKWKFARPYFRCICCTLMHDTSN